MRIPGIRPGGGGNTRTRTEGEDGAKLRDEGHWWGLEGLTYRGVNMVGNMACIEAAFMAPRACSIAAVGMGDGMPQASAAARRVWGCRAMEQVPRP